MQEQTPDLDFLNYLLGSRIMPLLTCLFLMQNSSASLHMKYSQPQVIIVHPSWHLLIPYVKLPNKIQIEFYYLLTKYHWSLRSEELLFQQKYFDQFEDKSNDIFVTLKICDID